MGPAFGHETGPYNENSRVLQGLAPCGPCAENRSCDGKRCLAVPPPEEALPLALAALGEKPEEPAPARDESRGRILSHKSEIRGGLMNLRPSDPRPEPLDNESLSAMVIKEGIRKALYADGRPGDAAKGAISGFGGAAPEKTTPRGGNPAAKPVSDGTEREKNPVLEFYPDPKPAEPLNLAKIRFNADYVARVGLDANPEIRKAFEETTEGCLGELFSSKGKFLH
jgi:hypothetical protein